MYVTTACIVSVLYEAPTYMQSTCNIQSTHYVKCTLSHMYALSDLYMQKIDESVPIKLKVFGKDSIMVLK